MLRDVSTVWYAPAPLILLLSAVLGLNSTAQAPGDDKGYLALWQRGEYHRALEALDTQIGERNPAMIQTQLRHDRARLRFATGRVDEAIEDMVAIAQRRNEPSYSLELALMYRYRGRPLLYDTWMQRAAAQTQGQRWYYQRRSENFAAVGRIAELAGTNPKTILSAHYEQGGEFFKDLGAEVDVSAGDLAYRNAGYDIAEGYYLKALEKEPVNQDALAGLIECYWKSHDKRIEPMLQTLAELNPNHPRADAVRAERRLEMGDTQSALEIIKKQLAINPVSHRFRALMAAAYFLDDDQEAMRTVIDEATAYNPVWSEIYRTVGRLASRHYRFEEAMAFQREALVSDPKDYEARALYTLDLMRLGREDEGRQELQRAFDADPYNVQLYNLLQLMDTLETFVTVERGAFVLRLPKAEEPIMAEAALDLLDEAIVYFEAKYDVDLEKPVLIEMFDSHDDFMVRSVGLPGNAGHLGICFGKLVTMDAPSVRPKGSSNWHSVLWHEFVHVITLQKTKNRMPRWLSEGISVYEEGERSPAWHNRLDPQYRMVLAVEGLPALSDIDAFFTNPRSPVHLMFGYFVGGEFVRFYVDRYGFEALVNTLGAIAKGTRTENALVQYSGVSAAALDEAFEAYLEDRFEPLDNLPKLADVQPAIASLLAGGHRPSDPVGAPEVAQSPGRPASPLTDALNEAEQAAAAQDWATAEAEWKRAHQLFPDYEAPDAPLRRLAALYKRLGRDEDYLGVVEQIVDSSPQQLEAATTLVDLYKQAENWEQVVAKAEWALGIDPYGPALYRDLVTSLTLAGRATEALGPLGVLIHLDAGKATEYRLQRAQILRDLGKWASAKREVLTLLESVPHYWEAQRLLLEIAERDVLEEPVELEAIELGHGLGLAQ